MVRRIGVTRNAERLLVYIRKILAGSCLVDATSTYHLLVDAWKIIAGTISGCLNDVTLSALIGRNARGGTFDQVLPAIIESEAEATTALYKYK